jgi:hypothetical protein
MLDDLVATLAMGVISESRCGELLDVRVFIKVGGRRFAISLLL